MEQADRDSVPISPGLEDVVDASRHGVPPVLRTPDEYEPVDGRTLVVTAMAIGIGVAASLGAELLSRLIALVTNLAFFSRWSTAFVSPGAGHRAPASLLLIPILGGLIVGVMARYGSAAIRGHGIPEVMERVLFGESRIPARVLVLKPLSAAIAIGTGGPFGAEGPIIATGGALGSLMGQLVRVTADERKTLLGAGAAAGMAATFGTPVSAVLLAVELLLFEYRARSLVPVALAAATATGVRIAFHGTAPVFPVVELHQPSGEALVMYGLLGAVMGFVAAAIIRATYAVEDAFERFGEKWNLHWMWWPAIGAVAVGCIGLLEPRTLGVGYDNIIGLISGSFTTGAIVLLVLLKFFSWAIYLGSGTSGGTMAPLFTIGSGIGAFFGILIARALPGAGVDPHLAGLVGMAALFGGASHALLASIVLAFETTRQPVGLLPLLTGCTAAYLITLYFGRHSIMTEKLARRGVTLRTEYALDYLSRVSAASVGKRSVATLRASDTIADVRAWLASGDRGTSHQGFPVVDASGALIGVLTRRDVLDATRDDMDRLEQLIRRPPIVVFADSSLRDAADLMVIEHVGRLPIVERENPQRVIGILSRSDLLAAHAPRLREARESKRLRRRWTTLTSRR